MVPRRIFAAIIVMLASSRISAQPLILLASPPPQAPVLTDIAARTINLEVLRAGLRTEQWVSPEAEPDTFAPALRKAEETGSQFVFLQKLTLSDGIVDSDFSFIRVETGRLVIRRRRAFPFDLNLDSLIAKEVRGLLSEPDVREAVETAAAGLPPPVTAEPSRAAALPAPPAGPSIVVTPSYAVPAPPSGRGYVFDARVSPVLVFGDMSELFPYGLAASLFGGYRFLFLSLPVETGVRIGALRIFPDRAVTEGRVYAALAGIEFKTELISAAGMSLAFRASAGPAVVAADVPDESLMAKTVAFAEGGFAASARISRRAELGMELGFLSVFEDDYPIMGFMPTIVVRFFP